MAAATITESNGPPRYTVPRSASVPHTPASHLHDLGDSMQSRVLCTLPALAPALVLTTEPGQQQKEQLFLDPINVNPPHISTDKAVKYDYDIVYVRTPRKGDRARSLWTEIAHPAIMDPNGDLMLLHP